VRIRKGTVDNEGSCNYCSKGALSMGGTLNYPYKEVITVRGNHVTTVFCEECFNELKSHGIK